MTFDRDFLEFMDDTITVEALTTALSTDGYAVRSYGAASSMKARIEQKRRLVKDAAGREIVSNTTVYVPPYDSSTSQTTVAISASDRITLSTGYVPRTPPIIYVERHNDDDGRHHQVVYL